MYKIIDDDKEMIIRLDESDIQSAIRQFICSCYPELNKDYSINPTIPKMEINVRCKKQIAFNNQCCDNPEIIQYYEPRPAGLDGEQLLGNYRIMFKCKNCGKLKMF